MLLAKNMHSKYSFYFKNNLIRSINEQIGKINV